MPLYLHHRVLTGNSERHTVGDIGFGEINFFIGGNTQRWTDSYRLAGPDKRP